MSGSVERTSTRRSAARHARRRSPVRGILVLAVLLVGGATVATAAGSSGTFALLNASESTAEAPAVLTSGTAELTVSRISMPTSALYPGLTVSGPVTVTNTGAVPLSIAVSGLTASGAAPTSPFAAALVFGVGTAAPGRSCTDGGARSSWTGTFASVTPGPVSVSVPAGESRVLCVSATLPQDAPAATQGQPATDFLLRLIGTQI
ncbi:hypothetical protein [Herbiconiux liangxiaofengii]|uniref:hypothetical protein n=1 Tax=Herbiconiux liangxiaofengii TaxID=3342795 RepID=UPI0035B7106C